MSFGYRMSSTAASVKWFGDLQMAEQRLVRQRTTTANPACLSLVVGLQCGGSDAFSGVTANPAVDYAADPINARRRYGIL
jgi:altronate dehydratase